MKISKRKRVAVFQVVPVHDQNGIAIDTTLIEDSGKFRGQGVNGILFPNGEVHFNGKNFKQKTKGIGVLNIASMTYTELTIFPNGLSDNQNLIRESGIYQYQEKLTETGVKSQVVIASRPVLSENFLVLETEVLDITGGFPPEGEMTMPFATADGMIMNIGEAWDGDNNRVMLRAWVVYLPNPNKFLVYYGVSVSWADQATYPITIDPSITEQPDESAGKDARIIVTSPTSNFDATGLYVGESNTSSGYVNRSLLQFDISSIPLGSIVTNTDLYLRHYENKASNDRTMNLYRLKRNWVESQVTWNKWNVGNSWSTAGVAHTIDDRDSVVHGSVLLTTGLTTELVTIPMGISGVQDWVDQTTPNYGWLLQMATEIDDSYRFEDSSGITVTDRPYLTVTYDYNPISTRLNVGAKIISPSVEVFDTRIKLRAKARQVRLSTGVSKQW